MSNVKSMIPESVRARYRYLRARALSIGLDGDVNHAMSLEERRASADISVIVPIHDAPEVAERCLRSLERNGGDAEVILIDDGSRLERTLQVIDRRLLATDGRRRVGRLPVVIAGRVSGGRRWPNAPIFVF